MISIRGLFAVEMTIFRKGDMTNPRPPSSEIERLAALHDLDIMDTGPETEFDALVQAASLICDMPISLISLVDKERQWFKAHVGLPDLTETSRDNAFCAHTIMDAGVFEIPDAAADSRFSDNPFVTGYPHIRFYAGAPVCLHDGSRVGALCVIDRNPGHLNSRQREVLRCLADVAAALLENRRGNRHVMEKNRRLANIIDGTHVGTWEKNLQTGAVRYNERWAQIVGYTLAEIGPLSDRIWLEFAHPDDVVRSFHKLEEHLAGRIDCYEEEVRLRHKLGHWVWVLDSGQVMTWTPDGKPEWVFGTLLDITTRKQQEEALRKSKVFLDRTGELAGVGGWEVDLETGEVYLSEQTCRIYGVPFDYHLSTDEGISFYAPEAQPVVRAALERAIATGEGWDLESPFIRRDGTRIWVRGIGTAECVDSKPVRLVGAFQDVTERVAERLALQTATERIALAADSGGIGIWQYDIASKTLEWDAWMYRLFGLEPRHQAEPVDLWSQNIHPDDLVVVNRDARDAILGKKPFHVEYRVLWPDGSVHHLQTAARVTRNDDGWALRMIGTAVDVTESRQLTADLARQHELLSVTLRSIADAVITTDEKGLIAWLNPVAERMTGWLTTDAKGLPLTQVFQIINEKTRTPADNPVELCLAQGEVVGLAKHRVLISRDGTEYGIEDSAAPIRNDHGELLGVVLVFHDVTEQRRLSDEMSYRATHDALTGLVNRAEFEAQLGRLLQVAHASHSEHALLFIDLDQFKLVNDTCGHAVGDQLLQQMAKLLAESVRARDTLARLGGDEFGILLERCTAEQAQRVAQQVCDRMEDFRFIHEERRFRIGTSIGLVPVDNRWATTEAIMQAADTSCYAAKEAGRNRVHVWFDEDITMRARHGEMQWTTRIEHALDEDRFVLFAQHIKPLQEKADAIHVEVLLRMIDSDGSLIPPGAFLPAAERFHLASRIDRWVVKRAITWMQELPSLARIGNLSVNLSGHSVGDRAFHRWAIDMLEHAGPSICTRLCFEITETAAVTNLTDAAIFFEHVRAKGVRVALDDFGAGASSFGYLKTIPVDYLKIDGQFVRDLLTDSLDEAAVRCFVDVAKVVGVKTVAEFVEESAVLERLRAIGVDFAQGYLLHKPAPIDELTQLMLADTGKAKLQAEV